MTSIYTWSVTAADNDDADAAINWTEFQQPDSVNNSARQMMGRVAEWRTDLSPAGRASTGSTGAYVVISSSSPNALVDGFVIWFIPNHTNPGAATLKVGSFAAKPLRAKAGTPLVGDEILSGVPVGAYYNNANDEFLLINSGHHVVETGPGIAGQYNSGLRVGDVVLTLDTTPRSGRLRLGEATQTVMKTAYPELNQWASDMSYPWGSDATTFTLPSAAGYFLRFAATTSTIDTSGVRTAGSTQTDQNKAHTHGPGTLTGITDNPGTHTHSFNKRNFLDGASDGTRVSEGGGGSTDGSIASSADGAHTHVVTIDDGLTGSSGGDEVRAKNVAMHADIIASASEANADVYAVNGYAFTFDTGITNTDPGAGNLRINNADPASATALYVSELGHFAEDITSIIAGWDDSTSTIKGTLHIYKVGAPGVYATYRLTGAITDEGAWQSMAVTHVDSAGTFSDGDLIGLQFSRTGDKGEQGAAGGGLSWTWDTGTTDADPGAGNIRADNATTASITEFYVSTTDADSVDETDWLDAIDDSTSTNKGKLQLSKSSNPSVFAIYNVSALTTASGYRKIAVSYLSGPGGFSAADGLSINLVRTGDKGDTGDTGTAGSNGTNGTDGADGTDPGLLYTFSTTTTDSDPGAGVLRANNADLSAATALYIDDADRNANNHEATILGWDDIGNATLRGQLIISTPSSGAQVVYNITGASTDNAGYTALAVTYSSGATSFADAAPISVQFIPSGNDGAGAVDSVFARTGAVVAANSDYDITQIDFSTTDRIAGRVTAGAGLAEELTATQVRTLLNVADGATASAGDALVANPLSQFAATTSSQLAGVISDGTGSGALVFATSPTLVTPALGTPASGTLTNCTGYPASSTSVSGVVEKATDAEVYAATADKALAADHIETASAYVALTDAATIALDWDAGINRSVTLGGNRTLGNPTNGQPGTWRKIKVTQDGTGSRTLSFAANYKFAGGTAPTLSTTAGDIDTLDIYCDTASVFHVYASLDWS